MRFRGAMKFVKIMQKSSVQKNENNDFKHNIISLKVIKTNTNRSQYHYCLCPRLHQQSFQAIFGNILFDKLHEKKENEKHPNFELDFITASVNNTSTFEIIRFNLGNVGNAKKQLKSCYFIY